MATSGNPLPPNAGTDIDSAGIHDIRLKNLESGEIDILDPDEEEEFDGGNELEGI